MDTVLNTSAASVFYDGFLIDPGLDHPEGIAVHRDGSIWCGGERGQIYRIEPDASSMEQVASSGGFSQGMAFDSENNLYVCDLKHAAVMRLDAETGEYEKFVDSTAERSIKIANYPTFGPDGKLYVSDSNAFKDPGPGIFQFDSDGAGKLWYDQPIDFANGLAFSPDGLYLYVAETFGNSIFRIPLEEDGSAGEREEIASLPRILPDGLAFDTSGNLYVGCYEPSQVLRITTEGVIEQLIGDEEAHLLCHPTNVAFRNNTLFTTNLGRWHITAIETEAQGLPLYGGYGSER